MTNKEYYGKEIEIIKRITGAPDGTCYGINAVTNTIMPCSEKYPFRQNCKKCKYYYKDCSKRMREWSNEEVDTSKMTQEKIIIDYLNLLVLMKTIE